MTKTEKATYMKKWRKRNAESRKIYSAKYRATHKEEHKTYMQKYNIENADTIKRWHTNNIGRAKLLRQALRKCWQAWLPKRYKMCKLCGYDSCFASIEQHHTDPTEKEHNVSRMFHLAFNEKNKRKVLVELAKTVPLCATCHRELHYYLNHPNEKPKCATSKFKGY